MSAGPGPGGGGGGYQGPPSSDHGFGSGFGFELPPLENWSHLPPESQLRELTKWRDQKAAEAASLLHAPSSQSQAHHPLPPRPQVILPGSRIAPFVPPEIVPRRIEAARPPPNVYHPIDHDTTTTTPRALYPIDFDHNTTNTTTPAEVARNERESSFDQDYQRWESEVVHGRPAIPTDYVLVPRIPAPGPALGPIYISAAEAARVNSQQPAPSIGVQARGPASSTALPEIQNLSIHNPITGSVPTAAIESSSVNPQPAATAAAEPHPEVGIGDVQEIFFPHLEDLEFQPLTAPVRGPATKEDQAPPSSPTESTEAVSSKTAKNRAKKAKQKEREKAKKAAAAAAAIVVDSDESSEPGPVDEVPASPEEVAAPVSKAKAKKARKKAKRAAAVAAEAEENNFLDKMKEDSKLPISRVMEGHNCTKANWTVIQSTSGFCLHSQTSLGLSGQTLSPLTVSIMH